MKIQIKTVFPLMAVFAIAITLSVPTAFADDTEAMITTGSVPLNAPGCEETNECYTPGEVTVDVGGKITMTNTDAAGIHTFTSGTVDGFVPSPDDKFDSGILSANQSFEWSPDAAGEYPYYCMLHVWMQGTIIVQEADAMSMDKDTMMVPKSPMSLDEIVAEIKTGEGIVNKPMTIDLTLTDLDGNGIEHITYNIKASQGSAIVLDEEAHMHKGILSNIHTTDFLPMSVSESNPVNIRVDSVGFGHNEQYMAVPGEIATKQIVPEFGTIAMMILAVAIISIVAVSAKSRLSIMPRV